MCCKLGLVLDELFNLGIKRPHFFVGHLGDFTRGRSTRITQTQNASKFAE
jgi:hypothetical protein